VTGRARQTSPASGPGTGRVAGSGRAAASGRGAGQPAGTGGSGGFGIEGYRPRWHYRGRALAAAHRARFRQLVGQPLHDAWLMWDLDADRWFADGPVILGFADANVEITHRKFDECAITWDQVDMLLPLHWSATPTAPLASLDRSGPQLRLDWRAGGHPALARVRGRRLREVNVVERLMPAHWRPTVLHAVELVFDPPDVRLAVFNALDENGLTDDAEIGMPVGHCRRIRVV